MGHPGILLQLGQLDGEAYSGELPAGCGWKEITICGAEMTRWGDTGTSPHNHLAGRKSAIVFAQRIG